MLWSWYNNTTTYCLPALWYNYYQGKYTWFLSSMICRLSYTISVITWQACRLSYTISVITWQACYENLLLISMCNYGMLYWCYYDKYYISVLSLLFWLKQTSHHISGLEFHTLLLRDIHVIIQILDLSIDPFGKGSFTPTHGLVYLPFCYYNYQWLLEDWWFSPDTLVSSTNKTDTNIVENGFTHE